MLTNVKYDYITPFKNKWKKIGEYINKNNIVSVTYVNPLYSDRITEAYIEQQVSDNVSILSEIEYYDSIEKVAKEIYGADGVSYAPAAAKELKRIEDLGMGHFPVCMAKTQYLKV